jgi:hypothetical protein
MSLASVSPLRTKPCQCGFKLHGTLTPPRWTAVDLDGDGRRSWEYAVNRMKSKTDADSRESQRSLLCHCFMGAVGYIATLRDVREAILRELTCLLSNRLAANCLAGNRPLPEGHGRGLAVHDSFGSFVAEVAEVSVIER